MSSAEESKVSKETGLDPQSATPKMSSAEESEVSKEIVVDPQSRTPVYAPKLYIPQSTSSNVPVPETHPLNNKKRKISVGEYIKRKLVLRAQLERSSSKGWVLQKREVNNQQPQKEHTTDESKKTNFNLSSLNKQSQCSSEMAQNKDSGVPKQESQERNKGWAIQPAKNPTKQPEKGWAIQPAKNPTKQPEEGWAIQPAKNPTKQPEKGWTIQPERAWTLHPIDIDKPIEKRDMRKYLHQIKLAHKGSDKRNASKISERIEVRDPRYIRSASDRNGNAVNKADKQHKRSTSDQNGNAVNMADNERKRCVSKSMHDDSCGDVKDQKLYKSSKSPIRQRNDGKTKRARPSDGVQKEKLSNPPKKTAKEVSKDKLDVSVPSDKGPNINAKAPIKLKIIKTSPSSYTCTALSDSQETHVKREEEAMETSTTDTKDVRPDSEIDQIKAEKRKKSDVSVRMAQQKPKEKESELKIDSVLKKEGFVARQVLFCTTCSSVTASENSARKHIKTEFHRLAKSRLRT